MPQRKELASVVAMLIFAAVSALAAEGERSQHHPAEPLPQLPHPRQQQGRQCQAGRCPAWMAACQ
jgi:hypothetical protein